MYGSRQATQRMARAATSLQGLSCGDAFGERFFVHPEVALSLIAQRTLPSPPWRYTDDTAMAISVVEVLEEFGQISQENLASNFGMRFLADPHRGYGAAMHGLLPELAREPSGWREASQSLFRGTGSFGNGAAMRAAPLGAYFADDIEAVVNQAEFSATITHSHREGIAGAIAVALAAALAWQHRNAEIAPREFLRKICESLFDSEVRRGICRAMDLSEQCGIQTAVSSLGNGANVSAQDTVPFSLWAAAHNLRSYEDALWTTVGGLGDRDTTCAIVGGIVALSAGTGNIPDAWIQSREAIPAWFLYPRPT